MKIDYCVNPIMKQKNLILSPENESEKYHLQAIALICGLEYRQYTKPLIFELKWDENDEKV